MIQELSVRINHYLEKLHFPERVVINSDTIVTMPISNVQLQITPNGYYILSELGDIITGGTIMNDDMLLELLCQHALVRIEKVFYD